MIQEIVRPDLLGNFADISVGSFNEGKSYIRKTFGDKSGGFTELEAMDLARLMIRFTSIAHNIGLPVPDLYGHYISNTRVVNNRTVLNQVQKFSGNDVQYITKNDKDPISALRGYLNCFRIVADTDFQIALDVHLANFCQSPDGEILYVDLMPPRQKLEDGTRFCVFPRPTVQLDDFFVDRIFSIEGQLPDMYSKMLRALAYNPHYNNPDTPFVVRDLLLMFFGVKYVDDMLTEVENFKRNSTDAGPHDVNSIRIVAAENFFKNRLSIPQLEETYSLTHFSPQGEIPNTENINRASQFVVSLI